MIIIKKTVSRQATRFQEASVDMSMSSQMTILRIEYELRIGYPVLFKLGLVFSFLAIDRGRACHE